MPPRDVEDQGDRLDPAALDYDSGLAAARGLDSPLSCGRASVELVGMTPETLRADRLPLLNEA